MPPAEPARSRGESATTHQDADVWYGLRRAAAADLRATAAWLLAGLIVGGVVHLVGIPAVFTFMAESSGAAFGLVALRRYVYVRLAMRDLERGRHLPRQAVVALISMPIRTKYLRPLLAIWWELPQQRNGRLPKPDRVLSSDDQRDALEVEIDSLELHEAWVDTGPRRRSTPRWVLADAGVAVPHHRAFLGRLNVYRLSRSSTVSGPRELTIPPPAAGRRSATPGERYGWSYFVFAVLVRILAVAALAAVGGLYGLLRQ